MMLYTKAAVALAAIVLMVGCAYPVLAGTAGLYTNPVVSFVDTPDPGVLFDPATKLYYAATTSQSTADAYPIRASSDLVSWNVVGYIFPANSTTRPKWAVTDFWAPEIHAVAHNYYVAVYAARDTTGVLCVGAAYSTESVLGPFIDLGKPLVRNASVGNIDPTLFYDQASASWYIVWKEDGNGAVPPEKYTPIWAAKFDPHTLTIESDKVTLIVNDLSWEGNLVEAPWIIHNGDYYYLFYSANAFYNASYAVGVARATSLLGPYTKHPTPLVHSNSKWAGPGHCAVVQGYGGEFVIVYHSWLVPYVGGPGDDRMLLVDVLSWTDDGWPSLATDSPSVGPVPVPN
jgi:beta-xylosidase